MTVSKAGESEQDLEYHSLGCAQPVKNPDASAQAAPAVFCGSHLIYDFDSLPAEMPASIPVAIAHVRLYPPQGPTTSSTSPAKYSPFCFRDCMV